jgi:hypothetical protein
MIAAAPTSRTTMGPIHTGICVGMLTFVVTTAIPPSLLPIAAACAAGFLGYRYGGVKA